MQKPGKSGRGRGLVDMSERPAPFVYARPVGAVLEQDGPMQMDEQHSIYVRQWVYRGLTVEFALTHLWEELPGRQHQIVRYDCCHSEVHKHQLIRGGDEASRTVFQPIDSKVGSWEQVDGAYQHCFNDIIDNMDEHFRRWSA